MGQALCLTGPVFADGLTIHTDKTLTLNSGTIRLNCRELTIESGGTLDLASGQVMDCWRISILNGGQLIGNPDTLVFCDDDGDGIADGWEIFYFTNLITADAVTDFDHDGYTDRQEFLNDREGLRDPSGNIYDPKVTNAPGGNGFFRPVAPIWLLLLSD